MDDEEPGNPRVPGDNFPIRPERTNEPMDLDVIYGPYTRYPRRLDDLVCVLTTTQYVVSCSVGPDPRNLRPFSAGFDTGSGPNLIRKSALFDGRERYLVRNETVPRLGDANGRPLRLLGVALIRASFGNSLFHLPFVVADSLAVDVIIGTRFMNQHVDAIECRRQCVKIHRGCVLPVLPRNSDGTFTNSNPTARRRDQNETNEVENQPNTPGSNTFNHARTVRLTTNTTIPPMSEMAVPVASTAAGLVYLEPKAAIQQRHRVRTANGVADIKTNDRFAITIYNFSKTQKCLPKGTAVAYAKRNLLAIHALPDKASRTLESVLQLPFERPRKPTKQMDHNPRNPNHRKALPPTGELPLTSTTLATPTSENVSSRCSKRTMACARLADLAEYPRPNTVFTSNLERNPSAACPTDKAPPCATRPQRKSEKCSTQALLNPQPPNGIHQSSSYRKRTVPYVSVSTTAA